jgi:hypothetical protein
MQVVYETFDAEKGRGGCRFWQPKAQQAKLVCNWRRHLNATPRAHLLLSEMPGTREI